MPTGDSGRITAGLERRYVGSAFYSPAQPVLLRFDEHSCVVRHAIQWTRGGGGGGGEGGGGGGEASCDFRAGGGPVVYLFREAILVMEIPKRPATSLTAAGQKGRVSRVWTCIQSGAHISFLKARTSFWNEISRAASDVHE